MVKEYGIRQAHRVSEHYPLHDASVERYLLNEGLNQQVHPVMCVRLVGSMVRLKIEQGYVDKDTALTLRRQQHMLVSGTMKNV